MRRPQGLRGSSPLPSAMPKILNLRKKPAKIAQEIQPHPILAESKSDLRMSKEETGVENQVSEKSQISWETLSFYYNPQKKYLYVIEAVLLASAAALFVFKQDILTPLFLALSSLVLFLYGRQKPALSKISAHRSTDRTPPCGGSNRGSIPRERTNTDDVARSARVAHHLF